ncbi:MAG: hypothetical protein NTV03_03570 [Candidatus Nomurabacteria bacterium]|nr:hypothetical protein [Candidatus Nomurabacteria bacterium]
MDNKGIDGKTEVTAEAVVENQNNMGPEKGISKGEERYNQIAGSISNAKNKVSGWLSSGAAKFGRLFKTGAVGVLNSPEAVVSGVKATGQAIGQEAGYIKDAAKEGYNFVGEKVGEGIKSVGDDLNKLDKYTSEKVGQAGEWLGRKGASVYETTSEGLQKAKNFTAEKTMQAGNYIKDKALTVEAVGSLMKEKTVEKLNVAKEGIRNNYGKAVEYGRDAIDTATLRAWYAKDAFNAKMNAIKKAILERKAEVQADKLQKTLAKLAQYNQVGQMNNLIAA